MAHDVGPPAGVPRGRVHTCKHVHACAIPGAWLPRPAWAGSRCREAGIWHGRHRCGGVCCGRLRGDRRVGRRAHSACAPVGVYLHTHRAQAKLHCQQPSSPCTNGRKGGRGGQQGAESAQKPSARTQPLQQSSSRLITSTHITAQFAPLHSLAPAPLPSPSPSPSFDLLARSPPQTWLSCPCCRARPRRVRACWAGAPRSATTAAAPPPRRRASGPL